MIVKNNTSIADFFKFKVLIDERLPMESQKKNCWTSQQGTEQSIFRVIFWTRFDIITTMILQNNNFITNFFWIESFDCWTFPLGEPETKIVEPRSREQSRANSELSFRLGSPLSLQWFCEIPFSEPTSFKLKVLLAERVPLESQKKKICWTSQ